MNNIDENEASFEIVLDNKFVEEEAPIFSDFEQMSVIVNIVERLNEAIQLRDSVTNSEMTEHYINLVEELQRTLEEGNEKLEKTSHKFTICYPSQEIIERMQEMYETNTFKENYKQPVAQLIMNSIVKCSLRQSDGTYIDYTAKQIHAGWKSLYNQLTEEQRAQLLTIIKNNRPYAQMFNAKIEDFWLTYYRFQKIMASKPFLEKQ